jgi:hypothetical protein
VIRNLSEECLKIEAAIESGEITEEAQTQMTAKIAAIPIDEIPVVPDRMCKETMS